MAETRGLSARTRQTAAAYAFLSPWIAGMVLFIVGPIVISLILSFTDYDIVNPSQTSFVGVDNYTRAFANDPVFWKSVRVTITYSLMSLPLHLVVGFALSLLLNHRLRGISWFRSLYYLPAVISGVAVTLLWVWILNPRFGLVNHLLSLVGVQGPDWFFSTTWVLPSFVLISLWGIGPTTLIYLAMLQAIPTHLYEAAEIDGAGALARLRHITLPLVTPAIFFNLVLGLIGSFQFFTTAYVGTKGGPQNASRFYALYLFDLAFRSFKMGYASALAWILLVVVALCTWVLFRTGAIWVYYQDEGHKT